MASDALIANQYVAGKSLGTPPSSRSNALSDVVRRFRSSPDAIELAGFWVALDTGSVVIDKDLSAAALKRRVDGIGETVITFATPLR